MSRRFFSIVIASFALIAVLTPAQLAAQDEVDPVTQAIVEIQRGDAELNTEINPGG